VIPIGLGQIPGDTATTDTTYSEYQEAVAVATGVETNILVFVVPASPLFHAVRFEFGGGNIGTYKLYFDTDVKAQYITWWNTGMNGSWELKSGISGGLVVPGGTTIKVTILHNRPYVANFYSRMEYVLIS
jgi:hypothetical protein